MPPIPTGGDQYSTCRPFYGSVHNTARTGVVIPVLGPPGHAGGMIRLRSGTVGARFTILYAVVFLMSGIGLLGLAFLLSGGSLSSVSPPWNPPAQGSLSASQERIPQPSDQL